MNKILVDILGEHYDSINSEIRDGKLEGVMNPKLYDSFDSWVYIEAECRFQLRKNTNRYEENISNVKEMFNKLYAEARKFEEPRHLNSFSSIECLKFGKTTGADVMAGNKKCNYISFFGFPMGN